MGSVKVTCPAAGYLVMVPRSRCVFSSLWANSYIVSLSTFGFNASYYAVSVACTAWPMFAGSDTR
jgi:hypothetical protein